MRKSAGTLASQKGGKKQPAPKDNTSEGRSNITLNAAALGSALAEDLKSSFEGLRNSMNAGFTGLGALIASHSVDEVPDEGNDDGDSNGSKDDDESLVDGEPPAKKSPLAEPGNDRNPLISKLTKTLQLTARTKREYVYSDYEGTETYKTLVGITPQWNCSFCLPPLLWEFI